MIATIRGDIPPSVIVTAVFAVFVVLVLIFFAWQIVAYLCYRWKIR